MKSADTTSPKGLKQTVDEVAEFVQVQLPVLMEIVRKGGRFQPESIAHLRESFQEVIGSGRDVWKNLSTPDNFAAYAASKSEEELLHKVTNLA